MTSGSSSIVDTCWRPCSWEVAPAGSIPNHSHSSFPGDEKREIKLPNVWSQPAERSERHREDQNRWQDDASGREPVEQNSNARRNLASSREALNKSDLHSQLA
jgi:hypothetical protein